VNTFQVSTAIRIWFFFYLRASWIITVHNYIYDDQYYILMNNIYDIIRVWQF